MSSDVSPARSGQEFLLIADPEDDSHTWRLDRSFLESSWACIWGHGCEGILDQPAEALQQGCCSVGAQLLDTDEARMVQALAATLDPRLFQNHQAVADGGALRTSLDSSPGVATSESSERFFTRLVDDACIFLNRPDFEGGAGCALHLAAGEAGEPVSEWKPSVCWQAPLKVDHVTAVAGASNGDVGAESGAVEGLTSTVRPWTRKDWLSDGATMAWLCTEEPAAFVGEQRVVESLEGELTELLGPKLYRSVVVALGTDEAE